MRWSHPAHIVAPCICALLLHIALSVCVGGDAETSSTTPPAIPAALPPLFQVLTGAAQFGQDLVVKHGVDYTLSAYFRVTAAPTNTTQVSVAVALQQGYSPWAEWGSLYNTQLTRSSGWRQVVLAKLPQLPQAAPGKSTSVPVPALFVMRVNTPGVTVCVDDAFVAEAGAHG